MSTADPEARAPAGTATTAPVTPTDEVGRTSRGGRFHSPARQAAVLAASTGLSQIALAVMFVITARLSSPAEFGVVGTAYAISLVGASIIDFGTNALWTRELIAGRMMREALRAQSSGKLLLAAAVAAVIALAAQAAAPGSLLSLAGALLVGTVASQTAQVPLRARLRSDLIGAVTVADRSVAIAVFGLVLLIPGLDVVIGLVIALCSGLVADALLALRFDATLRRTARPRLPYRGARHFGLMSLAVSAQSLDVVAIGALGGPAQAGLFAAVNRWTSALGLLVTAFSSATTPFVAESGDLRRALPRIRPALWMPAGAVVCCVVIAVAAPWVVELLLGPQYAGSATVLRILAVGTVPAIFAQPLATYLQALGHDRVVAVNLTVIVVVQLLGVAAAALWWSVSGVAVVIALGQLAMAVALTVVAVGVWRDRSPARRRPRTEGSASESAGSARP